MFLKKRPANKKVRYRFMKLGAQLYSLRTFLQTPEDIRATFQKVKAIGYENVQLSGAAPTDANVLKSISEECELPIVITHSPIDRIINDTDALIKDLEQALAKI